MVRAWDYWPWIEQENYNPDGTMKEDHKKFLLQRGESKAEIGFMEAFQKSKLREFNEREELFQRQWGMSYVEWAKIKPTRSPAKAQQEADLQKSMKKSLFAGEDISELPGDIDPDDYYDAVF